IHQFQRVVEKVTSPVCTFVVQNPTPEFASIDGTLVYDELLRLTDPKFVVFEMDAGWVVASGPDPVSYLRNDPQRFRLMHVKDMVKGDMIKGANGQMHATELGRGIIDYAPILRAA